MTKSLSLLSIVAAFAAGGYLISTQLQSAGSTAEAGRSAEAAATAQASAANLQAAARALDAHRLAAGTYAGAQLGGLGVRLVRADAAGYCAEAGAPGAVSHLAGPGRPVAPGPCR